MKACCSFRNTEGVRHSPISIDSAATEQPVELIEIGCPQALIGDAEQAGYRTVSGKATVDAATGENHFEEGDGMHSYVVKCFEDTYYKDAINARIR